MGGTTKGFDNCRRVGREPERLEGPISQSSEPQ